jgi:dTDP-4-dehydrorhamnose 3,5-epimerase
MKIHNYFEFLEINGPIVYKPSVFIDKRGFFVKDYLDTDILKILPSFTINETFYSFSYQNVFRGFHFQIIKPQIKIVNCLKGSIIDFAVDLRPSSKYFKKIYKVELSEYNNYSFIIPKGFGHGFIALKDSIVSYKCNGKFIKEFDSGIKYNDPSIGLNLTSFGITESNLIISDRDLSFKYIDDLLSSLDF